jgi:hypothetical protein
MFSGRGGSSRAWSSSKVSIVCQLVPVPDAAIIGAPSVTV